MSNLLTRLAAGVVLAAGAIAPAMAADLTRMQGLLSGLPQDTWVQASTGLFSSAFPSGSVAVDVAPYNNPSLIVTAWSSFAWDSTRGNLMLFGGGHANYAGNEMYLWNAASGAWTRGSLPSQIDSQGFIPDNSAPQTSHTYDNNQYLPIIDRFIDFGGAAFPGGGTLTALVNGSLVVTGPWLYNPALANANKVGGTTASGYDVTTPGGNMWTNRRDQSIGTNLIPANFINGTAAYRAEGGKDAVYITADPYQSGWPQLFRYTAGSPTTGSLDTWELVGVNGGDAPAFKGTGTIDLQHNLFVRTASFTGYSTDLMVWSLAGPGGSPTVSKGVSLAFADGTPFVMTPEYGIDYDSANGLFYAWDGSQQGKVYVFGAQTDSSGNVLSQWTVKALAASTPAAPAGNFATGVLGKWHYVPELDAFLVLDEYRNGDAQVWMYKAGGLVAEVPESGSAWLMLSGLAVIGFVLRRRRPSR